VLYIGALAAPDTVNTMPEETLLAFDAHGRVERTLARDGGDGDETVAAYGRAGIDVVALANQLQMQGAKSFDDSWQDLLDAIGTKSQALA
jgi:transaldolase